MLISLYRKKERLSQRELALKLGVTDKTVSKWETDQSRPSAANLRKMEELFDTSLSEGYRELIEWDTPQQGDAPVEDQPCMVRRLKAEAAYLKTRMQQVLALLAEVEGQPM